MENFSDWMRSPDHPVVGDWSMSVASEEMGWWQAWVMTSIDQSQASIQVTWSVWTNQKPVFRSRDQYCPITSQYSGHVICVDQSQASICLMWSEGFRGKQVLKVLKSGGHFIVKPKSNRPSKQTKAKQYWIPESMGYLCVSVRLCFFTAKRLSRTVNLCLSDSSLQAASRG